MKKTVSLALIITLMLAGLLAVGAAADPGAIWTTDEGCYSVNRNIYFDKCDVYLNGGPANRNDPGLPYGQYYYQVTDPSGVTLLSTADITQRLVTVGSDGRFVECVQICPFDDTPNNGNEYKVWLTKCEDYDPYDLTSTFGFKADKSKTDNFKVVKSACPPQIGISGYKFYDANTNRCWDSCEPPISCWLIALYKDYVCPDNLVGYAYTDECGKYVFRDLEPGTYIIREIMPLGDWVSTCPESEMRYVELCNEPVIDMNFGNVCLGCGGGKTLGYWSNKNGQAAMACNWWKIYNSDGVLNCYPLSGLPYTNASAPYLSDCSQIKTFLLNANAVDMQYMLAAQWLTMAINVRCEYVNPCSIVYTGCCEDAIGSRFIQISDLLSMVRLDGCNWDRAKQECFKNVLDCANNNRNFVQPCPCLPIDYPDCYPPCTCN
ncbi:MAG: hypothetical protein ABFD54_14415 [Armatimonadota bacterium]|nr:hypothetical protein [bacterium]